MFTSSIDDSDEDTGGDLGKVDVLNELDFVYGGSGFLKLECGDTATADERLSKSCIVKPAGDSSSPRRRG
jgi:hypothetical protein